MPSQPLSIETLKLYFNGQKHHRYYPETVKMYEDMRFHANGECYSDPFGIQSQQFTNLQQNRTVNMLPNNRFNELILQRRPNESEDAMEYRVKIYEPQTKNPITKVINSLSKIRRSPDWNINYEEVKWPARIPDEETLEDYCEENYPGYESLTNWVFSVMLKNYCIDPNAVVAVFPMITDILENEFYQPVATLFNSDHVIYFEEGAEYVILQSTEMAHIADAAIQGYKQGKIFYVFTKTEMARYEQVDAAGNYIQSQVQIHNLGYIPCFKIPSVFLAQKDNTIIQESRLSSMMPHLNEAAREYSDLQASKVQHMYPLFWYYENRECGACNGVGKAPVEGGPPQVCKSCAGSGKMKFSPFSYIAVQPPNAATGETTVPTPPAGYITRDVDILKHQDESVDRHIFKSLAALNMQFLDQTPLNISGDAKQVDREELNNFVYNVAEDLISAMDKIYKIINDWRYSFAIPDKKARKEMLPKIAVPENFDLLPADYLIDNITKSKNNKLSPILIAAMETDYASKTFYATPNLAELIALSYQLDPLCGISEDEKMTRLSNNGITEEDYIISSNIISFLRQLINTDPKFCDKPYKEQMAALHTLAVAQQKVISKAEQVRQTAAAQADPNNPQPGNDPNKPQPPAPDPNKPTPPPAQ